VTASAVDTEALSAELPVPVSVVPNGVAADEVGPFPPAARPLVVGRDPGPRVRRLGGEPGVEVPGAVGRVTST
jgi:hypothetical protein